MVNQAGSVREERQVVTVADGKPMRAVKVRQTIRVPDIALVIPCRVEGGLPVEVASSALEKVYAAWKYPALQRRESVVCSEW